MGRGAQQATQNLTDQQLTQQNQYLSQEQAADASDRSLLIPAITSLLNSQGYTSAQQSAITQEGMDAAHTQRRIAAVFRSRQCHQPSSARLSLLAGVLPAAGN
jgi:hypothetical protein